MTRLVDLTTPSYPCVGEPYHTESGWIAVVHDDERSGRFLEGLYATPEEAMEAAKAEVERMKNERNQI